MSSSNATVKQGYPPTEHVQGIVERVTFHNEESGYTVLRFNLPGERELVTAIGSFPEIHAGQTLRLTGFWREHPKYGRQFQCLHAQEIKPATLTGLEKYLGSGLIKGIGPVTAKRIVKHFGLETLEIIEQSCSRLIEVPGIGERRVGMIERTWETQKAIKERPYERPLISSFYKRILLIGLGRGLTTYRCFPARYSSEADKSMACLSSQGSGRCSKEPWSS